MSDPGRTRLAVLGSPISHSRSPATHRAAYGVLGLPWEYGSAEVTGESLPSYLSGLDETWRGLSLTMPLKRDVLPLLAQRHPLVDAVGAANTVRIGDDGLTGFNTDVPGVVASFRDAGVASLRTVLILGGGATAASVLAGVAQLGARRATVLVRTPARAADLIPLGERLGVAVDLRELKTQEIGSDTPDAVISTLPGGADLLHFPSAVREGAVLFDIAYDPWPSPIALHWSEAGGRVISGLELLLNQALGQVRIFVQGDPDVALPDEAAVIAAMRAAL